MVDRIFETVKSVIIDQVINSKKTERLVTNDVKITCSCCMETVSKPRNIMTLEEIKHLLNKDTNKILMELCFRNETDFGNSLEQLIKDIGRFIDKQISILEKKKEQKGFNSGYKRFVAIDNRIKRVIKLQHELISYKNKFTVTNHEGYIYLTYEGKDFFKKIKQKFEKKTICFNPQDLLQQIEENKATDDIDKKRLKRRKKKQRYKENKKRKEKKLEEEKEKEKSIQKKSTHNYSQISKLDGKAFKIIMKDLINGLDFSGEFPKNDNEYDEEYRNAEEEKSEKKELEELKILLQKCSSP